MAVSRSSKRRAAGVASAKILITSASVAATIGGWAAISAMPQATLASANVLAPQLGAPGSNQAPGTTQPWPTERRRRHFGQGGTQPAPNGPGDGTQSSPPSQLAPQGNTPSQGQPTAPLQPQRPITRTHSSRSYSYGN